MVGRAMFGVGWRGKWWGAMAGTGRDKCVERVDVGGAMVGRAMVG